MKKRIIDRRSFLKACGVLSATVALAACGSTSNVTSDTQSSSESVETVSESKTLTFAAAAETTQLSPLYMGSFNYQTTRLVYESLVKYEDGEVKPCLAESWEFNDDGTVLTFHLRQGVTSLSSVSDAQEFFDAIVSVTQTDDPDEVQEIYSYLINYDLDNAIDIPLTYSKDMIVYNSEKISGYTFNGAPCFFDPTQLKPAE